MNITLSAIAAMDATQLRSAITQLETEISALHLDDDGTLRDLTPREDDELNAKLNLIQRAKASLQSRSAFEAGHYLRGFDAGVAPDFMRQVEAFDGRDVASLNRQEARSKALKALEQDDSVSDAGKAHVEKLLRSQLTAEDPNTDGDYLARRALITSHPTYLSAFREAIGSARPLFTNEETHALRALDELEKRAMGEVTPSAGGYGVPFALDPTIMVSSSQEDADLADFLRVSNVKVVTTNEWRGVSSDGTTWAFQTESAEVSDNSPTLAQPTARVHTARGFIPFSLEVEQDYAGFIEEISALMATAYNDIVAEKLTLGTGTGEPNGILTVLSANTSVRVTVTTGGTIGGADVYKVWSEVPKRFRRRSTWMSAVTVQNRIRQLGDSLNSHSFTVNLVSETIERMFNKPYLINDEFTDLVSATGTQGQLVVGDFSNFVIASRAGMRIERVDHLFGTTSGRPTGQRGLFTWARVGSTVAVPNAFRLLVNKT